ncbi:hypothetical protein JCM10049v2_007925 [Rhodotorula toruloides]
MPHTLPPVDYNAIVDPVIPAGHGKPAFHAGDDLPAHLPDSKSQTPSHSRPASPSRAKDPFFRRDVDQTTSQREASLSQVRAAQDASYEADLERALRRSKREYESERKKSGERSASRGRGLSRIREAIRDIVNDPFWHRPTKDEAEHQDDYMKRIIMDEISAARASSTAAAHDREARSKSRSRFASRNASRVRAIDEGVEEGTKGREEEGKGGLEGGEDEARGYAKMHARV